MEQLMQRVRIKLGTFELELEGPAAYEEFRKFRDDGFDGLMNLSPSPLVPPAPGPSTVVVDAAGLIGTAISLPSLADLAILGVGESEREWIAIYALYLTDRDNKRSFAMGDVWNLYKESERDNRSRQSNLSSNMKRCIEAQWLTKIKDDTYALAQQGREHALQIVSRRAASNKAEHAKAASAQGK